MPLIKCPDCEKSVSDKAHHCIHCGCPMQSQLLTTQHPAVATPYPSLELTAQHAVSSGRPAEIAQKQEADAQDHFLSALALWKKAYNGPNGTTVKILTGGGLVFLLAMYIVSLSQENPSSPKPTVSPPTTVQSLAAPDLGPSSLAPSASLACSDSEQLVANVWPGKKLYLASDCSLIGTIVDVEDDYKFPDGTERNAILISFKDGSTDWIPRETAQRLYLTR